MEPANRARLNAIFDDVRDALRDIVIRHRVTAEEYHRAIAWFNEPGDHGPEIVELLDLLLSPTLGEQTDATPNATEPTAEGPFYVAGAPMLERPYVLPRRVDEPGEPLIFSGAVSSTDGRPLAGAVLEIWQANGAGEYSHVHPGVPDHNLRGRLTTDDDGRFQFETVVPSPYELSLAGATARLFAALGRRCFRPGHIHLKVSHGDTPPLTTQIYFEDDPFIDSDVAGAVKPSLVTKLARDDGDDGRPYATCSYDFVLPAAHPIR
jgi:catechol 1,2-dioxygenase